MGSAKAAVASDPRAEDVPFEDHSSFVSGYSPRRVFFTYYRCASCDALYCPVFYTEKQLGALYRRQAENMSEVPLPARERTQLGYAKLLMQHSRGRGGFIEVGADIGLFAEQCAMIGQFDHLWLYEPNEGVHGQLDARFRNRPHTVRSEMWPRTDHPRPSCSTGALIHVLDHLLNPAAFVTRIADTLEEGGVILAVTHDTGSLLARLLGRRFPPFALQHPQLYSPASLTRLFERTGFEVTRIAPAVNYFPLMYLVRAGMTVLGLPLFLPRGLGPTIPVRLGNMAVVARKRSLSSLSTQ